MALVVYFWIMGRSGVILMKSGEPAAIGLGIGIFVLPLIGLWAMVATLRAGFAHQRLARLAHEEGVELDVSDLPKRPSGRIERDAADALFESVRDEVEARPDDWRVWYRLARAYDYAGTAAGPARPSAKPSVWSKLPDETPCRAPHSVSELSGDVRGGARRGNRSRDRGR